MNKHNPILRRQPILNPLPRNLKMLQDILLLKVIKLDDQMLIVVLSLCANLDIDGGDDVSDFQVLERGWLVENVKTGRKLELCLYLWDE